MVDSSRKGKQGFVKRIMSAAARYTQTRLRNPFTDHAPNTSWQERAWDHYDHSPEVRFAAGWVANAMSKATLYAGRRNTDGSVDPAPDDHPAAEIVASIAGGPAGQSQFLADFGPHLVVAGEGWVVIKPRPMSKCDDWHVLSVLELKRGRAGLEAEITGESLLIPAYDPNRPADPEAPVAIRVWDPHPRRHIEADSPIRSSLDLLDQLRMLDSAITAVAKSRLTGRGVLLIPQGTRFPSTPGQQGAEDDLLEVFMQVAETAIREPDSAAATVPIILEVPQESIGQIQLLTFESQFDDLAVKLREELIKRFAMGLDTPAEVLLGMSNMSHWGAWATNEEAVRLAVEPRLALVADALTDQYLRPLLGDQCPDVDDWVVWYDTSALRVRSNRAQTALEVYDRGAISAAALRRETGFDEADAPDPTSTNPGERQTGGRPGDQPQPRVVLPVDETPGPPQTDQPGDLPPLPPAPTDMEVTL